MFFNQVFNSRIPIPTDRDEQARRRAAVELQSRKREIEREADKALGEIRVKIYELKLQERLLIEDRDRQLISLRREIEERKNIVRPVRLLFDDSNLSREQQITSVVDKQTENVSRLRPPVARRRSRSLNAPRFEVSSSEDQSLSLFDENQDSPTFHNNQIMLLPKSAAKNPESLFRTFQQTWSRIQTPPRSTLPAKNGNAPPMNSISKRLHEQIHGLFSDQA